MQTVNMVQYLVWASISLSVTIQIQGMKVFQNYKHPSYAFGSKEAKSFLAGSHKFCTTEIEVYTKE